MKSKFFSTIVAAIVMLAGGILSVHATPLDKLIGKSLTIGNFVFSNFSAPGYVGASPSQIDVQGETITDPTTGVQRTGLRFTAPFSQGNGGGPHEIILNVNYYVTDLGNSVHAIQHSFNGTANGSAAIYMFTTARPFPGSPTATYLLACIGGSGCSSNAAASDLFADTSNFYVEQQVQMVVSGHRGVAGTTSLQSFEVLFTEL